MPDEIPPTKPDDEFTVPTAGVLLLHVPDGVVLDNVVVAPTHTVCVPVIAFGNALIVATLVIMQLVGKV